MARFGFNRHDLKDQSTLKFLISEVRLICEGVTPMRSNTGETGIENSFGESRPVFASVAASWAISLAAKSNKKEVKKILADIAFLFIQKWKTGKLYSIPDFRGNPVSELPEFRYTALKILYYFR